VLTFAERAAGTPDPALAAAGSAALARLRRPLTIAVVGRVSAGKSTLVNALLETEISPTAGGECTRVVYVFRHGRWTTAQLMPRTPGPPVLVHLVNSRLPDTLALPADQVRSVDVTLPSSVLERVTLVDTPGLQSTNQANSAVTERLLQDTSDAAVEADALLFCLNDPLKDDEAEVVRSFRSGRGVSRLTAGTAVGILTKADVRGGQPGNAWKLSVELADTMSRGHADLFSSVVPVIGLLAETATTGGLREHHARALGQLAHAWNADRAGQVLAGVAVYRNMPSPIDADLREELLQLLGLFGIRECLEVIRAGCPPQAGALTTFIREISGFDDLLTRLRGAISSRADVLKAAAALERLMECAREARDRSLYAEAQSLLDRPEMFPLRILEVAQQLAKGRVAPPKGLIEQAWVAVQTGLPRASSADAARAVARWREWGQLTDGEGRRLARVMVRAWQLCCTEEERA